MVLEKSQWELASGRSFQFIRPTFTLWMNPTVVVACVCLCTHLCGDVSTSDEVNGCSTSGNLKSISLQLLSVKNKQERE